MQFHLFGIYQQFCMNAGQNSRKLQFSVTEIYKLRWCNTTHSILENNNNKKKGQRLHKNGLKSFNADETLDNSALILTIAYKRKKTRNTKLRSHHTVIYFIVSHMNDSGLESVLLSQVAGYDIELCYSGNW